MTQLERMKALFDEFGILYEVREMKAGETFNWPYLQGRFGITPTTASLELSINGDCGESFYFSADGAFLGYQDPQN